jgi:phosphoribosyl 1,2-cyclic phosphodiesterase
MGLINSLSVCVLGSSSAGNATLIRNSGTSILVDCGFTPAYIEWRLEKLGLSIGDLGGVLITHVHGDHVNDAAIRKLVAKRVAVYCPPPLESLLKRKFPALSSAAREGLLRPIKKTEAEVNELAIRLFAVPHDSHGGCFGYSIFCEAGGGTTKISVATDLSHVTKSVVGHFADSDIVVIESNYDVEMLENSARPAWLKRRIQDEGHLSNDQCADALLQIIDKSQNLPKYVVLAHISQECNTNALAVECTETALSGQGIRGINVFETHPDRPGVVMRA